MLLLVAVVSCRTACSAAIPPSRRRRKRSQRGRSTARTPPPPPITRPSFFVRLPRRRVVILSPGTRAARLPNNSPSRRCPRSTRSANLWPLAGKRRNNYDDYLTHTPKCHTPKFALRRGGAAHETGGAPHRDHITYRPLPSPRPRVSHRPITRRI